jgi:hypothetical protein
MRARAAKVAEQFGVGAAGVLQGVGEHRQTVEGSVIEDGLGNMDDSATVPRDPVGIDGRQRAVGIAEDVSKKMTFE